MFIWHPRFTTRIDGSPEIVFDLIADCRIMAAGCPVQKRSAGQRRFSPYSARVRSNSESFSTFHQFPQPKYPRNYL